MIEREDQDEKLEAVKNKYKLLKEDEKSVEATIAKTNEEIADSHDRIAVAKEDKNKADASLLQLMEQKEQLGKDKEEEEKKREELKELTIVKDSENE